MRHRHLVRWVLLAPALAAVAGCESGTAAVGEPPVDRVLIVSLPGVAWEDIRAGDLPTVAALSEESAIGDLSTRVGRRGASTTDAYLSIGAGTRALAPTVDVAVALDVGESYGGVPTEDILRRRLGGVPGGVAYLAVGAAIDLNQSSVFGAKPGRLGTLLAAAGVRRSVIANADAAEGFVSDEPPPDGAYARGAATALMGIDGIVPGGTVGRGLLADDPLAPFGRRLDQDAVLTAFEAAWLEDGRSVVLVEASDLSRASGYAARASSEHAPDLRLAALASSDALLRELLARVDPDTDAVLVVSPVAASASPELAVVLLRAPNVAGGLLRSSTTRRDGYVQLADIAPTVLALLGEPQPDEIEGRAFEVRPSGGTDRMAKLVAEAEAAEFRDNLMPIVVPTIIGALALLAVATLVALRRGAPWRGALVPASLVALGVVPATFVASRIGGVVGSTAAYLAITAGVAAVVGAMAWALERRWPGIGPVAGTGAIVALFAVDVVVGAPLQLNAVFGYSVAVAGRFVGLGNLAFALFGSATVVLAALVVDRFGRRGLPWVLALLAGVVLLEGLPMLGADVGGVVSMVPAFGVTALVLAGRRVRLVDVVALAAAAGAAVLVFAFIDVARPPGSRTHLARLAEHLLDGRWEPFRDSLARRLQASFGGAEVGAWALVIALVLLTGAYVVLVARGRIDPGRLLEQGHPPTTAAGAGLAVLAAVGLVANDSSIAVPATMLIVVVPVLVLRAVAVRAGSARVDMGTA